METARSRNVSRGAGEHGKPADARQDGGRGWQVIRTAALAALALDVLGLPFVLAATDPRFRAPYALVLVGLALLRSLIAYGAWHRTRWAAWIGGLLAIPSVLSPFFALRGGSVDLTNTGLAAALDWAGAAVGTVFIVGIAIAVVERVKRNK